MKTIESAALNLQGMYKLSIADWTLPLTGR
jgi:hypothetical protein